MNFIRTNPMCSFATALLITTASGLVHADVGATAFRSDPGLQQIKFDAVAFEADLQQLEIGLHFPLADRVQIDASANAPDLQLQSFAVSVDSGPTTTQVYSHVEAIAFRSGGLQRVATVSAAAGTHHLHVTFSAMLNSGSPLEPTISGSFDQSFEKSTGQPLTLELALVRDDSRSAPALRPHGWLDSPAAGNSARQRESIYLSAARHYFLAAALSRENSSPGSPESLVPLAAALIEFGSREPAEGLLTQIGQSGFQAPSLAEAQLRLAHYDYATGDLDTAASRLNQISGQISTNQRPQLNELRTRVLLASGQYTDAIPLLRAAIADRTQDSSMARYNLAVALLNIGHTAEGRSLLDDLGQADAGTEVLRSLKDKANVVLGYDYLRRRIGSQAIPAFQRVRLDGPYASRALLGLGWARYSQHGHFSTPRWGSQTRTWKPDEVATATPIELPDFSGERLADIQQALIPWMQLRSRDALDPAVQESLLAIPYALQKAGSWDQAGTYYAEAISTLGKTADALDAATQDVARSSFFEDLIQGDALDDSGWTWQLSALPATRDAWLLRPLIAGERFQTALRDYRDARFLASMAKRWHQRLASLGNNPQAVALNDRLDALSTRIDAASDARRERVQTVAVTELQAQRRVTQTYLLQARMALARVYDSPDAEDAR